MVQNSPVILRFLVASGTLGCSYCEKLFFVKPTPESAYVNKIGTEISGTVFQGIVI